MANIQIVNRQKSVLYVSLFQQNVPVLTSFHRYGYRIFEIVPWSAPQRVINISKKLLPNQITSLLGTKTFSPKLFFVSRLHFPYWQLLNILIRKSNISERIKKYFGKLSNIKESRYILKKTLDKDILVLPSDYLHVLNEKVNSLIILEVRWHHTGINRLRPDPYLNFPGSDRVGETKWESDFRRLFNQIDGVIVYSEIAVNSFLQAGYPSEKFYKVPLEMPKPSVIPKLVRDQVDCNKFLYVGRSAFDKGLDIAVAAVEKVGGTLTVIGYFDSDIVTWLENFEFVNFMGVKNRFEIYQEMLRHNIYLTTGIESFGFAVLEALRCGMKVVGSEYVGALNWYGADSNVFLAESLNINHIVSAIHQAQESSPVLIPNSIIEIDPTPFWEKAIHDILW